MVSRSGWHRNRGVLISSQLQARQRESGGSGNGPGTPASVTKRAVLGDDAKGQSSAFGSSVSRSSVVPQLPPHLFLFQERVSSAAVGTFFSGSPFASFGLHLPAPLLGASLPGRPPMEPARCRGGGFCVAAERPVAQSSAELGPRPPRRRRPSAVADWGVRRPFPSLRQRGARGALRMACGSAKRRTIAWRHCLLTQPIHRQCRQTYFQVRDVHNGRRHTVGFQNMMFMFSLRPLGFVFLHAYHS